jgi:hypothetical protein
LHCGSNVVEQAAKPTGFAAVSFKDDLIDIGEFDANWRIRK